MPAVHFSTIISRTSSSFLSHISHLAKSFPNHPLLFTLSHNSTSTDSAVDLSRIVGQLTTFSSQSIGCLSAPLPGPHSGFTACSLAIFDPQNVAAVFRSTVPGKQRAQVGRWRPVGQRKEEPQSGQGWWQGENIKDWEDVWNSSVETQVLPEGLKGKEDVSSIVYLTDDAPEGLSSSLLFNYSNSSQVGLVASSTPFVNGRPFTLFHNKNVYDLGAVGIALKRSTKPSVRDFASRVSFVGLSPVSKPMNVTQCEGNMVISLDYQNPTQLLLSCIRESAIAKNPSSLKGELGFVLGVVEVGELVQVHNITAGDPSRGTISLGTQSSPKQGATVQFFHRGTNSLHDPLTEQGVLFTPYASTGEPLLVPKSLNFFSVAGDDVFRAQTNSGGTDSGDGYILHDTFIAASENGFLFSPKGRERRENSWTCAVPGALATLECVN